MQNRSRDPNLPPGERAGTFDESIPPYPPPPYPYPIQNQQDGHQMQVVRVDFPPQLPPLFRGQKVKSGPYTITVTDEMVAERQRENHELYRQWLIEQERNNMSPAERENEEYAIQFRNAKIRRHFIRKVYCIIAAQLAFTAGFIALVMYVESINLWVKRHWAVSIAALVVYIVTYLTIVCSERARRRAPCNWILLCLVTLSQSYMAAFGTVYLDCEMVFLALGMTAFVTVMITFIAMCVKFDLTSHLGMVLVISLAIMASVLVLSIVAIFTKIKILWIVLAVLATVLFSVYLFYDTQALMGGRSAEIDPDEYIYAAVQIYVDIIMIFRYILMCLGCIGDT